MRPDDGSIPSSTFNRSPALVGAMAVGVVQCARSFPAADVTNACARPFTMSVYATTSRLRTASNAGAGYEPGPRNGDPLMLKQPGGNRHTGFWKVPNCTGALHEAPRSDEVLTYNAVPFPPWMELSKVR